MTRISLSPAGLLCQYQQRQQRISERSANRSKEAVLRKLPGHEALLRQAYACGRWGQPAITLWTTTERAPCIRILVASNFH